MSVKERLHCYDVIFRCGHAGSISLGNHVDTAQLSEKAREMQCLHCEIPDIASHDRKIQKEVNKAVTAWTKRFNDLVAAACHEKGAKDG